MTREDMKLQALNPCCGTMRLTTTMAFVWTARWDCYTSMGVHQQKTGSVPADYAGENMAIAANHPNKNSLKPFISFGWQQKNQNRAFKNAI